MRLSFLLISVHANFSWHTCIHISTKLNVFEFESTDAFQSKIQQTCITCRNVKFFQKMYPARKYAFANVSCYKMNFAFLWIYFGLIDFLSPWKHTVLGKAFWNISLNYFSIYLRAMRILLTENYESDCWHFDYSWYPVYIVPPVLIFNRYNIARKHPIINATMIIPIKPNKNRKMVESDSMHNYICQYWKNVPRIPKSLR